MKTKILIVGLMLAALNVFGQFGPSAVIKYPYSNVLNQSDVFVFGVIGNTNKNIAASNVLSAIHGANPTMLPTVVLTNAQIAGLGALDQWWSKISSNNWLNILLIGDSVGQDANETFTKLDRYKGKAGSFTTWTGNGSGNQYYFAYGPMVSGSEVTTYGLSSPAPAVGVYISESASGTSDNDFWHQHVHIGTSLGSNGFYRVASSVSNGIYSDKLFLAYSGDTSGAGTFLIQTQAYGGSWGTLATVASAANKTLVTTNFTLPALLNYYARVVSQSGTQGVYSLGLWNTEAGNFTLSQTTSSGIENFGNAYLAGKASVTNWWAAVQPDLVLVTQKKGVSWMFSTEVNTAYGWAREASTNTSWCFVLPTPDIGSNYQERKTERDNLRIWTETNNVSRYDGWEWMGNNTNRLIGVGYYGDQTHPTAKGMNYYFRGLPEHLGFDDASLTSYGLTAWTAYPRTANPAGYLTSGGTNVLLWCATDARSHTSGTLQTSEPANLNDVFNLTHGGGSSSTYMRGYRMLAGALGVEGQANGNDFGGKTNLIITQYLVMTNTATYNYTNTLEVYAVNYGTSDIAQRLYSGALSEVLTNSVTGTNLVAYTRTFSMSPWATNGAFIVRFVAGANQQTVAWTGAKIESYNNQ